MGSDLVTVEGVDSTSLSDIAAHVVVALSEIGCAIYGDGNVVVTRDIGEWRWTLCACLGNGHLDRVSWPDRAC